MANYLPVKLEHNFFKPASGIEESLPPVIFLHGITGTKEYWNDIPQTIANETKRKVFALDSRNHGDSDYSEEFNFDLNVDDLFYFMDTIKSPRAIIVGHSMGGMTAMKAALKKPERIEMIFVEDMYPKRIPQDVVDDILTFTLLWIEIIQNVPAGLTQPEALQFALTELFKKMPPNMPNLGNVDTLKNLNIALNQLPNGMYDVKFNKDAIVKVLRNPAIQKEYYGVFNGPAYFIYGSNSPFKVGNAEDDIKKHFPEAGLFEIEGATHHVHMEQPDIFMKTILNVWK